MDRERRDPTQPGSPAPAPADVRLDEVRQSDLNEAKYNEEFLDWLKTKGLNYLLVALIALVGFIGWIRYKEGQDSKRDAAWVEFATAMNTGGPELLEQVAATPSVAAVDGIAALSRLRAADIYMQAVLTGRQLRTELLEADAAAPTPAPLNDETRTEYLDRADALYAAVAGADDGSDAYTIHAWTALSGRASVAEARGDGAAAADLHEQAAARVADWYPQLAVRSRTFAETAGRFSEAVTLPSEASLSGAVTPSAARPTPVTVDPLLESLIDPAAADDENAAGS
jgi:hypothetical protein